MVDPGRPLGAHWHDTEIDASTRRVHVTHAFARYGPALSATSHASPRSLSLSSIAVSSWRGLSPTHLPGHTSVRHILHIRSVTLATNSHDTPSARRQVDGDPDGLRVYVEAKQ